MSKASGILDCFKLKERIKLNIADPQWRKYKKNILFHEEKSVFIIGGPVHGNLGDHAIMEEEKKFLDAYFPEYRQFEILMPFFHINKKFLKDNINRDDIVCISGGGWMGNLWIHNEMVIREVVAYYSSNLVVIFPQTLYYSDDSVGNKELVVTADIFSKHKNLIFCVRDLKSYNIVLNRFKLNGNSKVLYCPDMVLYGHCKKPLVSSVSSNHINICIRKDREALYEKAEDFIIKIIPDQYEPVVIDTVVPYRVPLNRRSSELWRSWERFSNAKLTITDRLHAMLFSYINHTPCIALDNKTGKVSGVYKWIERQESVICVHSIQELSEKLPKMLAIQQDRYDLKYMRNEFDILAKTIRRGIYDNENKKIIGN